MPFQVYYFAGEGANGQFAYKLQKEAEWMEEALEIAKQIESQGNKAIIRDSTGRGVYESPFTLMEEIEILERRNPGPVQQAWNFITGLWKGKSLQ